ncbi:serine carboxypeptidase-like 18 isoform X3 [Rosa chinensis]|uniref:serine carboxypeptidase-like 18 isoform X3 n=1 Tax=Rosa chinensis TaxID=74649 RepID=UPI001AD8A2B9|nr:serine carboxypeptidase-like 18 isoform X3 [Rosa chinensis]
MRSNMIIYVRFWLWHAFILLLLTSNFALAQSIIKNLPAFQGDLPFKLETGYVGVGDSEEVQLFYYFVESERSPENDPLLIWLTGGPRCSSFYGLIYEIGPLSFKLTNLTTDPLTLVLNPNSWNKVANIIFLDAPAGTGYSYSTTSHGLISSDTLHSTRICEFLQKWLTTHQKFLANPLYVAGDSYSGKIVPIIAQKIADGIEAGIKPHLNLKGYIVGNPVSNGQQDVNSRIVYAHHLGLISDRIYQSANRNCKGEFVDFDPNNQLCLNSLQVIDEEDKIRYSVLWQNDINVRKALSIREGTKGQWTKCNKTTPYTFDIASSIEYHRNLSRKSLRVIIYSGDHDMAVPYISTLAWIESMNFTIEEDWRPWFSNDQVAGYSLYYSNNKEYNLTYATIKGGGHTAPEYNPKECFDMISRWLAHTPL